jgi:hypothetical protein
VVISISFLSRVASGANRDEIRPEGHAARMTANAWALDLGTTNTILTCWDHDADRPRVCQLPSICRAVEDGDPLQAPHAVPSALETGVNADRWLCATITDLANHKRLMREEPVVRLL